MFKYWYIYFATLPFCFAQAALARQALCVSRRCVSSLLAHWCLHSFRFHVWLGLWWLFSCFGAACLASSFFLFDVWVSIKAGRIHTMCPASSRCVVALVGSFIPPCRWLRLCCLVDPHLREAFVCAVCHLTFAAFIAWLPHDWQWVLALWLPCIYVRASIFRWRWRIDWRTYVVRCSWCCLTPAKIAAVVVISHAP